MEELRSVKLREAVRKVEAGIEETLTHCDFPSKHWTRIRTNNVIERLNREIRHRLGLYSIRVAMPSAQIGYSTIIEILRTIWMNATCVAFAP